MNKNDLITLKIEDLGTDGEGIGKLDGFAFFVKDAMPGDLIEAKIMKLKKNYGYARLEKVLEPSSFRIEPVCKYARSCGGCQLQNMDYKKQLEFKNNKVKNNLIRIGGVQKEYLESIMEPVQGMDEDPFHYRNKAQFPFGTNKEGQTICGFYAGRTHSIIANTDCALGVPENKEILELILEYMKECNIPAYNEETGSGIVRHALIRKGFVTGQLMVCLVINAEELPKANCLVDKLKNVDNMTSISISVNKKNTNVIMGDNYKTLWGKDAIEDELLGLKFGISPLSFYQVNPVQVERLYTIALDYADLKGDEEVWDICCGIGTITLYAAKRMSEAGGKNGKVHGLEIVPQAIENAKENAVNNKITNVDFVCAPAEEYLPANADKIKADVIIMDPPRKGMDEEALKVVADASPEKIVYVSCDSATLARDIKYLSGRGYKLEKVRAVDMFPQTVHVETVCLLSKLHEAKHHINIKVDMDELDLTSAEAKATYKEIEEWVQEHYGFHVTNLNIAQVKQKHGIIERENYNKPKSENSRQPGCPEEKVKAIEEALKFFQMI